MRKVAAVKILPSQLLTLGMSTSIAEKMRLLTSVTADLGVLKSTMNPVIERLQIRNDQMKSRNVHSGCASDIRLDCCHTADLTWTDAIAAVHEAIDGNRALGLPLSSPQLLACALQLQDTNALPLSALLRSVGFSQAISDDQGMLAKFQYSYVSISQFLGPTSAQRNDVSLLTLQTFRFRPAGTLS